MCSLLVLLSKNKLLYFSPIYYFILDLNLIIEWDIYNALLYCFLNRLQNSTLRVYSEVKILLVIN